MGDRGTHRALRGEEGWLSCEQAGLAFLCGSLCGPHPPHLRMGLRPRGLCPPTSKGFPGPWGCSRSSEALDLVIPAFGGASVPLLQHSPSCEHLRSPPHPS